MDAGTFGMDAPDRSTATNLTGGLGTKNEIRFRLVRTAPVDPTVPRAVGPRGTFDLTKPVTLSAYGQWTKKAGFSELAGGRMKELVYEDASFSTPVKAMKTDRFLFTRQTFVDFPDLRVSASPGTATAARARPTWARCRRCSPPSAWAPGWSTSPTTSP